MKKVATIKTQPVFQSESEPTQKMEFEIKECPHSDRAVRYPPIIRKTKDWYDQSLYEYCRVCGEVTRVGKW